jgi:hypothetical protein
MSGLTDVQIKNLQDLNTKFQTDITTYNTLYAQYTQTLTQTFNPQTDIQFYSGGAGYTYGTPVTSGKASPSAADCKSQCITNSSTCMGASFVPTNAATGGVGNCYMLNTEADVIPTSANPFNVVIIRKKQDLIIQLKQLNNKLLSANAEIINTYTNLLPAITQTNKDLGINKANLTASYNTLVEERKILNNALNALETTDNKMEDSLLYYTQQSMLFHIFLIIVCCIIFYISKTLGLETFSNIMLIMTGIFIIMFIILQIQI